MWDLNKRLEAYLARVKFLEEENELLKAEIQGLKGGSGENPWRAKHEEEVTALRATLDQAYQEKCVAELVRDSLYEEVQQVKSRCQRERAAQEEAKMFLSIRKKEMEEEKRAHIWLREKAAQLEKEIEALVEAHQEELLGLDRDMTGFSQGFESFRAMPGCFQPVEVEDYAKRLSNIWKGAVETYKMEVSQLEASLCEAKENLWKATERNRQNQLQLQQLEKELASLKLRRKNLEDSLSQQWAQQQGDAEKLQVGRGPSESSRAQGCLFPQGGRGSSPLLTKARLGSQVGSRLMGSLVAPGSSEGRGGQKSGLYAGRGHSVKLRWQKGRIVWHFLQNQGSDPATCILWSQGSWGWAVEWGGVGWEAAGGWVGIVSALQGCTSLGVLWGRVVSCEECFPQRIPSFVSFMHSLLRAVGGPYSRRETLLPPEHASPKRFGSSYKGPPYSADCVVWLAKRFGMAKDRLRAPQLRGSRWQSREVGLPRVKCDSQDWWTLVGFLAVQDPLIRGALMSVLLLPPVPENDCRCIVGPPADASVSLCPSSHQLRGVGELGRGSSKKPGCFSRKRRQGSTFLCLSFQR